MVFKIINNFLIAKQTTINMWQRVSFVEKNKNRKTWHDFVIYSPLKTCPPCKVQKIFWIFLLGRKRKSKNYSFALGYSVSGRIPKFSLWLCDKGIKQWIGCAECIRILHTKWHDIRLRIRNKKTSKAVWRLNFAIVAIKINKHKLNLEKW